MKIEEIGVNTFITINGKELDPIPSNQTRFGFYDNREEVWVRDVIDNKTYTAKVNELEDASAVISNVDYVTDRAAVLAYLAPFIGK